MKKIACAVLLLSTATAFAAGATTRYSSSYSSSSAMPRGQAIGYLVDEHFRCCGDSTSDLGLGVRGWFGLPNTPFFLHGEYQTVGDVDELRLGGGVVGPLQNNLMWLGKIEYIDFSTNGPGESGFGLHGGLLFNATPELSVFGTLGYLNTDNTDGLELDLGGQFHLTRELSIVGDFRTYHGSADFPVDRFHIDDLRVGLGYTFW